MNELSERARELIAAVGDGDGPTRGDRERVRRSLLAALAATGSTVAGSAGAATGVSGVTTASAVAAGAAGKVSGTVALWLVGGGVLGFATATPVAMYAASPPAVSVSAPARVEVLAAPTEALEAPAVPVSGPEAEENDSVAAELPAARTETAPLPAPAREAVQGAASVSVEVELLKSAQRALATGDAAGALRLLEQHALRFPTGALALERMAARIFALCELGRADEARRGAKDFLSAAPSSPLVPRVLASCAGSAAER